MPQQYHNFNPYRAAANNIATLMIRTRQNQIAQQQRAAQMAMEAPLREAQTRNYNAEADLNTEKMRGVKQTNDKQSFVNDELKRVMGVVEAGTVQNADGTVTMTPDATKAMSGAFVALAKSSGDLGSGIDRGTRAFNYNAQQDKNRQNQADMNDARIAGAGARNTATISSREALAANPNHTSAGQNTMMQDAKQRKQRAHAAMLKLQETVGAPFEFMPEPQQKLYQSYRDEYKRADSDLQKLSTPAVVQPLLSDNSSTPQEKPLTPAPVPVQGGSTPQAAEFDSEDEARASGHGTGSVIVLRGIGKVRLR